MAGTISIVMQSNFHYISVVCEYEYENMYSNIFFIKKGHLFTLNDIHFFFQYLKAFQK